MKPLYFLTSVLLGASGITHMLPDADRLAQRRAPQRIRPTRMGPGPAPVPVPVAMDDGGGVTPAERNDPVRCNAACNRTMQRCIDRCRGASNDRPCDRLCFTALGQCVQQCPGDAMSVYFPDAESDGPVLHTIPGR